MEVQCLKDVLRYVIITTGELFVMTVGVILLLKLYVDSLDSQLLVSKPKIISVVIIMF